MSCELIYNCVCVCLCILVLCVIWTLSGSTEGNVGDDHKTNMSVEFPKNATCGGVQGVNKMW